MQPRIPLAAPPAPQNPRHPLRRSRSAPLRAKPLPHNPPRHPAGTAKPRHFPPRRSRGSPPRHTPPRQRPRQRNLRAKPPPHNPRHHKTPASARTAVQGRCRHFRGSEMTTIIQDSGQRPAEIIRPPLSSWSFCSFLRGYRPSQGPRSPGRTARWFCLRRTCLRWRRSS